MAHVFISYSKKNRDYARKLADRLLEKGFDIWIDDRIDYGKDWWQVVVRAIRECGAFIVVMTPESEASGWVRREVALADKWGKPIFPLLRAGENWPLFVLIQYADVLYGQLPPDEFYEHLSQVVSPEEKRGTDVTKFPSVYAWLSARPVWVVGAALIAVLIIAAVILALSLYNGGDGSKTPATTAAAAAASTGTPTVEPSQTDAPTDTPTDTPTPTITLTPSETPTATNTPTATLPPETQVWVDLAASQAARDQAASATAARWEYAARGPESREYPWGSSAPTCDRANIYGCEDGTAPVGPNQRAAGASWVGALDMAGSVWEWTADRYEEGYYSTLADGAWDPAGPAAGDNRVVRGGSVTRPV